MSAASAVLAAVAKELAEQARGSLPKLQDNERITKEWYDKGVFYRETTVGGQQFRSLYDFRQRKSHRMVVVQKGE